MGQKCIIKAKKTQQINQREIRLINDRVVDGLLLIDIIPKGNSVMLVYNVEGLIGLKDFLAFNGISKKIFAVILRNIVVTLRSLENNKLNRDLMFSILIRYTSNLPVCVYISCMSRFSPTRQKVI